MFLRMLHLSGSGYQPRLVTRQTVKVCDYFKYKFRTVTAVVLLPFYWISLVTLFSSPTKGQINVGHNIQVSKAHGNLTHYETLLCADPNNADRLLGVSMAHLEEKHTCIVIVYLSVDRGQTWAPTLQTSDSLWSTDPACDYGPDGRAYVALLSRNPLLDEPNHLVFYRSLDGGGTWLEPLNPFGSQSVDREYVTVDNTGGKYSGRIYITPGQSTWRSTEGINGRALSLWRSLDRGSSFELPAVVTAPGKGYVFWPGNTVNLSDGTLVSIFGESSTLPPQVGKKIKVITSTDGGESFQTAVTVTSNSDALLDERTSPFPSLAIDRSHSPFKDRLYAVWPDGRSGRVQILSSYSTDKAKTWSRPTTVSDETAFDENNPKKGPNDLLPAVAVNREGVVGVMWYDRRESPNDQGWLTRFAASLDGGETFLQSVRVSEAAQVLSENDKWEVGGASFSSAEGVGVFLTSFGRDDEDHTAGMSADATGVFHPFWVDNRTGIKQIWTSSVTVTLPAFRNGSANLAQLEDLSKRVELKLSNFSFNRGRSEVSVDAQLKNISNEVLEGPINLRVIKLESSSARQVVVGNADNEQKGLGAVWDFSSQLKANLLQPGQLSDARRLSFQLSEFLVKRSMLVNMNVRVLGRVRAR